MSKKKLLILSGVAVVAIAAVAVALMKKNGKQALEVQTVPVKRGQVIETVTATGKVQPHIQVKISADVSAKITKLTVKEGDWVEKGELLVELDRERYVAAVERAEASLRSSQSEAALAKESVLKAEKDYLRSKELFAKKVESSAAYDVAAATYQVEKARHEAALNDVEQSKALLKQAKDDLSKTRIDAPMTGTISQLNKEVGEIALGSQFHEDVILVLADLVGMEALVDVDENEVVTLALSDTAHVAVDKEIGIRKSLGAKRKSILMQFLIEAILLCNVGEAIGVLAGFGLGNIVSIMTGFAVSVPMEWALGGLAFCTIIGLTFGMWPAIVASKLDPVKALSYE